MADHGIIDLHVHLFPERMFEAVWRYFETLDTLWDVHHEHPDRIAKTLAAHGVTRAVGLSYPHKIGVAESLNLFMESIGRSHPIFLPFASVHPDDHNFRQYADYALDSPYLFGFKFQPLVQKFDLNDPRLDYFYEQCLERDTPITMHIGTAPTTNEFLGVRHFRKLMRRFPDLRVCVPHMGGFEYDDFLVMLEDHPKMFFDTTMINTSTHVFDTAFKGDRERLMRHADRVCFGSDWPMVPYAYQVALDSLERFGFLPDALRKVTRDNALRFLNLKPEQVTD